MPDRPALQDLPNRFRPPARPDRFAQVARQERSYPEGYDDSRSQVASRAIFAQQQFNHPLQQSLAFVGGFDFSASWHAALTGFNMDLNKAIFCFFSGLILFFFLDLFFALIKKAFLL